MSRILVIDDSDQIRRAIGKFLTNAGHEAIICKNGEEGLAAVAANDFDLAITDLKMPVMTGLEFLKKIRSSGNSLPVILLTGHGSIDSAVAAMKLGASDYLSKPLQFPELTVRIERLLETHELKRENKRLKSELKHGNEFENIVGESAAMQSVFDNVRPLAADGNISVVLFGETGTGKELVAKALHYNGPRADKPFVAVNCGALPGHLLESELFGHEAGAFTDAHRDKKGLFEVAEGGTLFLDEIDSMPVDVQVKLLRAIEEREIRRVGGTAQIRLDIRFLAATSRKLGDLVESGEFRSDLFFRIAVAEIEVPPLRDRTGDVSLLINHFLVSGNLENSKAISFSTGAVRLLDEYAWPGNVRELKNLVERFLVTHAGGRIEAADLNFRNHGNSSLWTPGSYNGTDDLKSATKRIRESFERELILEKLKDNKWNVTRAASELGISRAALHSKLKKYGLRNS